MALYFVNEQTYDGATHRHVNVITYTMGDHHNGLQGSKIPAYTILMISHIWTS